MEQRFYDLKGLAQYLSLSPQTLRNKISKGDFPIPFKKIFGRIRFDRKDVEHFLNRLPTHHPKKDRSKRANGTVKLDPFLATKIPEDLELKNLESNFSKISP